MIRSKRSVFAIESALRFDDPSRFAGIVNPTRLAGFAVGMLLLVLGCAPSEPASLNELASSALSQIGGELEVPGLKAPVEILRDEWGIPHIYAQNDDDLFMAQGYVMAQDRLWQMEMWRRWHEGRLSEIFGPEAFDYDKRTRQMMFRGPWDASEWTSYHPDGERIFTAYANGVNAFIEQNRDNLPVEFQLTGVEPDPWTAQTVVLRWAQVGLSSVRGHAISEIQLAMNVAQYGAEEANRRAAPDPWDDLEIPEGLDVSIITQEVLDAMRAGDGDPFSGGRLPDLEVLEQYRQLTPAVRTAQVSNPQIATEGSNNWVMSGERSPTGIPIVSNDPHRRIEMPALRYFVHLNAPGWNVMGGGEPPFVGVDAGHNERMAWGFTFAGTDMVDVFVEEVNPEDPNSVRWQDGWEPLRVIQEEIRIKGEAARTIDVKFSRHGPVIYEDAENGVAYAVRSVVQDPGTAAYKGSFKMAQAESCNDFFERAMYWMIPTHSLICGDVEGNIALQVTGLTPNRDGWNGRLPVPGNGNYEWKGFRDDLPREFNPARGYIATANNNVHPPGYEGRPVFYHSSRGVETSRITRLHQILGSGRLFSVEDHKAIQHDAYSLRAEGDIPTFQGWQSDVPEIERARALIADWDALLTKESTAAAIYVEWTRLADDEAQSGETPSAERQALAAEGLGKTIAALTQDWGADWTEWTYGRGNPSALPHIFIPDFDLPTVERPGGFGTINATGANFRRIIDLSNLDNSVATNAPGQSAQPGSPFYGDLADRLGSGEYFPFLFTRDAVEGVVSHRLMLTPGG
jgi:penicillin amidase